MDEQAFFFPSSAHITVNDGACFPDGAGDCHNHLLNPVLPVTLWQESKVALSQILSWHELEKLPKGQPKAAEWFSPLAFHRQHPEDNQGARDRATAQMGSVRMLKRLIETETVLHGRTRKLWPICSQNEVNTTTFCGCFDQNRPWKLCHGQHWHGPRPAWQGQAGSAARHVGRPHG